MTTVREMSRHTPDRNAGVLSGHVFLWPVKAVASASCCVDLAVAIRPQPQARNASLCGSAKLAGLPVSAVGLTTRLAGEPKGALVVLISREFWKEEQ
jgi:hypothetical protein